MEEYGNDDYSNYPSTLGIGVFTDMGSAVGPGGEWRRMTAREVEFISDQRRVSPEKLAKAMAMYNPLGPDPEILADISGSKASRYSTLVVNLYNLVFTNI